jgi:hypothetical protein
LGKLSALITPCAPLPETNRNKCVTGGREKGKWDKTALRVSSELNRNTTRAHEDRPEL